MSDTTPRPWRVNRMRWCINDADENRIFYVPLRLHGPKALTYLELTARAVNAHDRLQAMADAGEGRKGLRDAAYWLVSCLPDSFIDQIGAAFGPDNAEVLRRHRDTVKEAHDAYEKASRATSDV